jgi:hypothetical protein
LQYKGLIVEIQYHLIGEAEILRIDSFRKFFVSFLLD